MILEHAQWLLFAWVLGNQAGAPVTVVPVLLGAGALAGTGQLNLTGIVTITVVAALGADLAWYGLGWWRGPQLLRLFGEASPRVGSRVGRVRQLLGTHHGAFQLCARFLPELNTIAAGFAGATRSSIRHFLCRGTVSAVVWAGAWIGCGYVLSDSVTKAVSSFIAPAIGLLIRW